MAAMIVKVPLQFGQWSMSKTRLSRPGPTYARRVRGVIG